MRRMLSHWEEWLVNAEAEGSGNRLWLGEPRCLVSSHSQGPRGNSGQKFFM